ncbi:MAG TPA: hypothetical protein VI365_35715, partial [Trebonia sp.]
MAWLIERTRQEAGKILGAITDDELMVLARIYQMSAEIGYAHHPSRFNGDALLFTAGDSGRDDTSAAEQWESFVSGAITETRLPCGHVDMARPDMLAQVWSAASAHLGLGESG